MNTNGEYNETSYGLGQFTKPTLEGLLEKGDSFEKVINDPDLSVKYMAKFISKLVNDYDCKTIEEIALAYNAGPGTLKKLKEKYGNDWMAGAQSEIDAYAKKRGEVNKNGRLYIGLNYVKKAQEAYEQISQPNL
jgi:soluble lytic murein transglycosylase-like protein